MIAVALAWLGAALLLLPRDIRRTYQLHRAIAMATLPAATLPMSVGDPLLQSDALGAALAPVLAAISLALAIAGPADTMPRPRLIAWHGVVGLLLLALLTDEIAVQFVAAEAATLLGLRMAGAARRALLICGLGLGVGVFGVAVLYQAAGNAPALAQGIGWSELRQAAPTCDAARLSLAYMLLLIGYGTLGGLAPLHGWLPRAVDGLTTLVPLGAATVALPALLRLRAVVAANQGAVAPTGPLLALGLLSLLIGTIGLHRRAHVLAASGGVQNGMVAIGFALGDPATALAGMLQLGVSLLARCAAQLGYGAGAGRATALTMVVLAGVPPFAVFLGIAAIIRAVGQLPWPLMAITGPLLLVGIAGAGVVQLGMARTLLAQEDRSPLPIRTAMLILLLPSLVGPLLPAMLGGWLTAVVAR